MEKPNKQKLLSEQSQLHFDFCMVLLNKIHFYGQTDNSITSMILTQDCHFAIISYRTQKVVVQGKISDSVDALSGVSQGTVLGPLLFICYINDLPKTIKSKIKMYADDTLVYSTISTIDDCIQFQRDLLELEKWSKIHQMD